MNSIQLALSIHHICFGICDTLESSVALQQSAVEKLRWLQTYLHSFSETELAFYDNNSA